MRRLRRRAPHHQPDDTLAPQIAGDFDGDSAASGDEDVPIEPFVPISGADAYDERAYASPSAEVPAAEEESAPRRRRLRLCAAWRAGRAGWTGGGNLAGAVGTAAGGEQRGKQRGGEEAP